jgi:protease-4
MKFFKIVFATVVGQIFIFTILLLTLIVIGVIFSPSSPKSQIKPNTVLKIALSSEVVERAGEDPLQELGLNEFPGMDKKMGLLEMLAAVQKASTDANISGIFIDAGAISGSLSIIDELRNAILDFKKSGKFVWAYGQVVSESGFYLASAADEFYLNPMGMVEFNGLSAEVVFFKKAMEKLGVKPMIFRVGSFKSAIEPFIREDMSPENDKQYRAFLGSMYEYMLQNISISRNLSIESLRNISNQTILGMPTEFVEKGLADGTLYYGEFLQKLSEKVGSEDEQKTPIISLSNYIDQSDLGQNYAKDKIGVVICEGEISDFGTDGIVGEPTAKLIRKFRLDDKIKAVVLRVNSPGGSVIASDVIWQEVVETQKVKPIIASMSSVAASGGYYISMACDKIVAQPLTLTGSIGIFGLWFDATELLNNKLGITFDTVNTNSFADFGSLTRPMKAKERQFLQNWIENGYASFLSKAAQGRKTDTATIGRHAQGRVWSGKQALELGLIDTLGNLQTAVQMAAKMANLDQYQLVFVPKTKSFFETLFNKENEAKILETKIKQELGELYPHYRTYRTLLEKRGALARLPFDISIK